VWKVELYGAGYAMNEKCFSTKKTSERGFGTKMLKFIIKRNIMKM